MATRRWDDPWKQYPASKPLAVAGGMTTSKRRGQMADTWWSKRFVDVLESYGLGARMQRGRRYARAGQVLTLDVTAGLIAAQVQGSRSTPYLVTVQAPQPSPQQWQHLTDAFTERVGFVAELLSGEVPTELEDAFAEAEVALFPAAWDDVRAKCNCPDWENPCKHIAAVMYLYADQLDADPWLLLLWRGRTRDEILGHLPIGGRSSGHIGEARNPVAPWWPLTPGATHLEPTRAHADDTTGIVVAPPVPVADPPTPPARVLQRMEPLDADLAGTPLTVHVEAVYETIVDGDPG